ncbi:MAG: hypothetical protein ACKN9V_09085 [Pseudomonadota bacterium]
MVLSILGFFLWCATTFAEPSQVYQGNDKGRPCFLYVHQEMENNSTYQVEVSTSYEHSGQGLGKVFLKFKPEAGGKMLEWQNTETKEFVKVVLRATHPTLVDPAAFRLNWMHFDHLHDATCSDLKPVREE